MLRLSLYFFSLHLFVKFRVFLSRWDSNMYIRFSCIVLCCVCVVVVGSFSLLYFYYYDFFFAFKLVLFVNVHGRIHNMQTLWMNRFVSGTYIEWVCVCVYVLCKMYSLALVVVLALSLSRLFIFAINDKISFDACSSTVAVAAKASAEQCAYFFTWTPLFLFCTLFFLTNPFNWESFTNLFGEGRVAVTAMVRRGMGKELNEYEERERKGCEEYEWIRMKCMQKSNNKTQIKYSVQCVHPNTKTHADSLSHSVDFGTYTKRFLSQALVNTEYNANKSDTLKKKMKKRRKRELNMRPITKR